MNSDCMRRAICCIALLGIFSFFNSENIRAEENRINIAVADFAALGVPENESIVVADFFRNSMVNLNRFNVVDRKNMETILAEQRFQLSGCTDPESAVKIGKILNVDKMVTGKVTRFEPYYYIDAQVIDVGTGKIIIAERIACKKKSALRDRTEELAIRTSDILVGKREQTKIDYKKTNPIFGGVSIGLEDINAMSANVTKGSVSLGYRTSLKDSLLISYERALLVGSKEYFQQNIAYRTSNNYTFNVKYIEKLVNTSGLAFEYERQEALGRKKYLELAGGPMFRTFTVEQSFVSNMPGLTGIMGGSFNLPSSVNTSNYGYGLSGRIGYKYYVTQDLSLAMRLGYAYIRVIRNIDTKNARNSALDPFLTDIPDQYDVQSASISLGFNIEF